MDERPTKRRGPLLWLDANRRWTWIVVGALALPVLYVASVAPMFWLAERDFIPQFVLQIPVYAPLAWACGESPHLSAAVRWYCGLWGVEIGV